MKPKNLKFPFAWEDRAPVFLDGVLYIPKYYQQHELWDREPLKAVLGSFSAISLEYCSGNGSWIVDKALQDSSRLWIAVEKRFDRVQKIWSKKKNLHVENLLIVCGQAEVFSKYYLSEGVVDEIFVNFPDPWPKDKHAKNRLFQKEFIIQMRKIIKKGGCATLVTDDAVYSEQIIREMTLEGIWKSSYPPPFYLTEEEGYGTSFFEELWRGKGKQIRYMRFI